MADRSAGPPGAVRRVGASPVISILAQSRLVGVVGGGGGGRRETRMRRSRSVLGVEAVLWEPGSLGSRLGEAAQLEPLPLVFACFAPLPRLSPVPRQQKSPKK